MATSIVVPEKIDIGAYSTEASTNMAERGNYDARVANDLIAVATAAATDINALQAGTSITAVNGVTMPAGGALAVGSVLRATAAGTAAYGQVDLADTDAVTGVLPSGNFAAAVAGAAGGVRLAGDLAGTGSAAATPRVGAINSATVPAGGALTIGNALQVSGAGALTYAPVNLAGGVNFVTGALPGANMAAAVAGVSAGSLSGSDKAKLDTIQFGTNTLSSGTRTISSVTLTASSRIFIQMIDPGAGAITGFAAFETPAASRNVGAGTFVVNAIDDAKSVIATAVCTFDWLVVN